MPTRTAFLIRRNAAAGLAVLLALTGCAEEDLKNLEVPRETWDIYTIQGKRVGYGQTTVSHATLNGQKVVKTEGVQHLVIQRFGRKTEQEVRITSLETPDGKLIELQSRIGQGSSPQQTTGRVAGDRLNLELSTRGKTTSRSIAWSDECRGPFGSEQSLERKPMKPGQRRTVRTFVPGFDQMADVEMTAQDYESVEMPTGTSRLLRINTLMRFSDGQALPGAVWSDSTGETLKTRIDAMGMETLRVTKALALENAGRAEFDLGSGVAVKVARSLPSPHQTKRVRYVVRLKDGDPSAMFVSGASQQVKSTGPHEAEVTVYALRPGRAGGNPAATADPPTDDDRRPNNMIQSDDPKIVAMARKAAGDEQDPWQVALALERYVGQYISEVAFSQAFDTAAEVAESRKGDCSEHAVLLIALARARQIPARAAVGLVYMPGRAFGYHMWSEVYVQKRWIPLDATLARGGIGAAHLKLAHSSLRGASTYSSLLPVIKVIGQLEIEIDQVE